MSHRTRFTEALLEHAPFADLRSDFNHSQVDATRLPRCDQPDRICHLPRECTSKFFQYHSIHLHSIDNAHKNVFRFQSLNTTSYFHFSFPVSRLRVSDHRREKFAQKSKAETQSTRFDDAILDKSARNAEKSTRISTRYARRHRPWSHVCGMLRLLGGRLSNSNLAMCGLHK
jgi:hypothetical protein